MLLNLLLDFIILLRDGVEVDGGGLVQHETRGIVAHDAR